MSQELWIVIAGAVVPFVIQSIKAGYTKLTKLEMSDGLALNVTYIMCIIFAIAARLLSGETALPQGDAQTIGQAVLVELGAVIALATVLYKSFISPTTGVRSLFKKPKA